LQKNRQSLEQQLRSSPVVVCDVGANENINIGSIILTPNSGAELIHQPVPVGRDHPDPSVAVQRQLQAQKTVEKIFVPPHHLGKTRSAPLKATALPPHIRPPHRPVAETGEKLHRAGILGAQKHAALHGAWILPNHRLSSRQVSLVWSQGALPDLVPMANMHRQRPLLNAPILEKLPATTLQLHQRASIRPHQIGHPLRPPPVVRVDGDLRLFEQWMEHEGRASDEEQGAEGGPVVLESSRGVLPICDGVEPWRVVPLAMPHGVTDGARRDGLEVAAVQRVGTEAEGRVHPIAVWLRVQDEDAVEVERSLEQDGGLVQHRADAVAAPTRLVHEEPLPLAAPGVLVAPDRMLRGDGAIHHVMARGVPPHDRVSVSRQPVPVAVREQLRVAVFLTHHVPSGWIRIRSCCNRCVEAAVLPLPFTCTASSSLLQSSDMEIPIKLPAIVSGWFSTFKH
jgi:hypothetical protein